MGHETFLQNCTLCEIIWLQETYTTFPIERRLPYSYPQLCEMLFKLKNSATVKFSNKVVIKCNKIVSKESATCWMHCYTFLWNIYIRLPNTELTWQTITKMLPLCIWLWSYGLYRPLATHVPKNIPPKVPLSMGIHSPSNTLVAWTHINPLWKQHLGWLSHFYRTQGYDQQTDTDTWNTLHL